MPACQLIPSTTGLPSGLLAFFDCQARALGAGGYQALATPGSTAQIVLTGLLTVFVALIGIRLLFGETLGMRDGVYAFVKIGLVLALAGSWPAYRTLIYDVTLRAPAQLASQIGTPSGLPGAGGDLAARLDGADNALDRLAIVGVGVPPIDQAALPRVAPPPFIGFDTFALGFARLTFLAGALTAFAIVRLGAGLLLALGPLFIGFLLFNGTRGLVEGWLRGLIGAALGALTTGIVLGVELTLLEPWLYDLLARRAAQQSIQGVPAQLLAVTSVFALALGVLLFLAFKVASGLRLPIVHSLGTVAVERHDERIERSRNTSMSSSARDDRSRAATVADAVAASQRRETALANPAAGISRAAQIGSASTSANRATLATGRVPLGQTAMRRTTTRRSASAARRDARA